MAANDDEEERLRSAALKTARSVLLARHRAEEALRKQSDWLRITLASIGDAVLSTDAEGRITFLNALAETLTGWTQVEAVGRNLDEVFRIVNESTRERVPCPVRKVLDTGRVVGLANHTILIARDGRERPIDDSAAPIRDESGTLFGVVLVFRDITDRKLADKALRDAERRKSAVLRASLDAIITIDGEGKVVAFNPAAETLFGYSQDEAIGEDMADLVIPEAMRQRHRQGIAHYLATGDGPVLNNRLEMPACRKDGSEIIVELVITLIDTGDRPLFTGFARDVTARKKAEADLADRIRLLALSADVGSILTRHGPLTDVLQQCAGALVAHLDGAFARIWVLDPRENVLILQASAGLYTHLDGAHGRVPVGQFKIGLIAEERKSHLTNAVLGDERVPEQEWARREGMVSFAGYPLVIDDRLVGVVAMFSRHALAPHTLEAMAAVADDIALGIDRRRAEQAIITARDYAESVVDTVRGSLLVLDSSLRVRSANRTFYQTFQTTREQIEGRSLYELNDSQWDIPQLRTLLHELLPTNAAINDFEVDHTFPLLGRRVMQVNTRRMVRVADEELILLAFEDITERKRAEERLAHLLALESDRSRRLRQVAQASLTLNTAITPSSVLGIIEVEARRIIGANRSDVRITADPTPPVGALTALLIGRSGRPIGHIQLTEKTSGEFTEDDEAILIQLAHMAAVAVENARLYEELRENDRRKDEFLATLAHELRNPLAPIRNSLQVMRLAGADRVAMDGSRAMIERQVQQMVRLVDDLLDISRISRGTMELRRQRVDLATVIAGAVETSRPLIERMGHTLAVTLPPQPVHLHGDLTRLTQVFLNLLNNAAKYSESGGHIILAAEKQDEEVVVRVCDTGIGIPADMLPRIFDIFTQVDRSLERSQGGLGIGLTLVKRLSELHGGSIEAYSDGPGRGSEFVVRLPILPESSTGQAASLATVTPAMPGRRILVVDDNRDSADSLTMILGMLGNEVCTAYDGVEAVESASAFRPAMVFLDIGLPRLNGYDAARRIRQLPGGAGMTLVALTGWGQEDDRRRSREAGFDHHLVKPVDPQALERLLREADSGRK